MFPCRPRSRRLSLSSGATSAVDVFGSEPGPFGLRLSGGTGGILLMAISFAGQRMIAALVPPRHPTNTAQPSSSNTTTAQQPLSSDDVSASVNINDQQRTRISQSILRLDAKPHQRELLEAHRRLAPRARSILIRSKLERSWKRAIKAADRSLRGARFGTAPLISSPRASAGAVPQFIRRL